MLDLRKSRFAYSNPVPVASTARIADEGMALVLVGENGEAAVKASTGTAGEVFYGFSLFERRAPLTLPTVANIPGTGAAFTQVLQNYIAGSALIKINGEALNGTTPEATIASDGTVSVIAAVTADDVINIVYTREPTLGEAATLVGTTIDATELDSGANVGCVQVGNVYTSCFNTVDDWVVGDKPKLGANGLLTKTGTGETLTNVVVISVPATDSTFLGLEVK